MTPAAEQSCMLSKFYAKSQPIFRIHLKTTVVLDHRGSSLHYKQFYRQTAFLKLKIYRHSLSVTPETIICHSLSRSLSLSLCLSVCLSVLLLKPISR